MLGKPVIYFGLIGEIMNHSDEQLPLLTMQIEYTNLDLESSYVYLAIYVLQIVVEKLLLTFLCKKPHTLMKFPFCLRPKSQLLEFR